MSKLLKLNETTFASGSFDKSIRVWNALNKSCVANFSQGSPVLGLKKMGNSVLISNSEDKTVKLWDLDTYKLLQSFQLDEKMIGSAIYV